MTEPVKDKFEERSGAARWIYGGAFVLALLVAALVLRNDRYRAAIFSKLPGAAQAEQAKPPTPPVAVTVGMAKVKPVPIQIRTFGTAEADESVAVKAQVGGELVAEHFQEGQFVKKGQKLFSIDARTLEANVKMAQANLARDTATMLDAKSNFDRAADLMARKMAAQREYDQAKYALEAAKAAVRADEAAVENAKIQLGYAEIASPLDGRTGRILIRAGNLVKVNDLPLVHIDKITPIQVAFSVPQQELPLIKRYMAAGPLTVTANLRSSDPGDTEPEVGTLTFIDSQIDVATGMIRLKATFDNKAHRLWPGQYVDVTLSLATRDDAVVVPAQAVQPGQQGQHVFVVRDDQTVELREVRVGRTFNNETVIEHGLDGGERVVTDGQLKLIDGSRIFERPAVEQMVAGTQPATDQAGPAGGEQP